MFWAEGFELKSSGGSRLKQGTLLEWVTEISK